MKKLIKTITLLALATSVLALSGCYFAPTMAQDPNQVSADDGVKVYGSVALGMNNTRKSSSVIGIRG
ncbi:hypothetical protein AwWohl_08550 [Gammaproteobacteria bacterium]|nr:hypothetical protein AwWohl_08550 [Gammaproteobacteria bacterium]